MVPRAAGGASPGHRALREQGVDGGVPLGVAEAGGGENVRLAGTTIAGADGLPDGLQGSGIRSRVRASVF
jgi:hypothetical protein